MNNYDVDVFMELTGLDITEDQLSAYERAQKRAFSMLENELGWSFKYSSQYEEVGKVKSVCSCPKFLKQIDEKDILPPDSVEGEIKLFPYDNKMSSLPIDPATCIYKIKLVVPMEGDGYKFITIKDLDNVMPRPLSKSQEIIKYVERCDTWPHQCGCDCPNCTLLAVDADWVSKVPNDMFDIVTDLIIYFMRHPYSLDTSATIKSESVDGHSVSYATEESIETNIKSPAYQRMLEKYMGVYSPYYKKVRLY